MRFGGPSASVHNGPVKPVKYSVGNSIVPTILTHAAVPLAVGIGLGSSRVSRRLLALGAICSMLPDLDVVAFRFGVAYADAFGHRGATHSLVFSLALGILAVLFSSRLHVSRLTTFLFVGGSAFSHGILDTFTNGGHGVALWWPFSIERIFSPWQVIEVSPLSLRRVFSERGLEVMLSELMWIWMPAVIICIALILLRRNDPNMPLDSGATRRSA